MFSIKLMWCRDDSTKMTGTACMEVCKQDRAYEINTSYTSLTFVLDTMYRVPVYRSSEST